MKKLLATFLFFLTIACSSQSFACTNFVEGAIITCGESQDSVFSFNEDGTNIIDENDIRYYTIII